MVTLPGRHAALASLAGASSLALLAGLAAPDAWAQAKKDSAVLAMTLESPGPDPTARAASAIGDITLQEASLRSRTGPGVRR